LTRRHLSGFLGRAGHANLCRLVTAGGLRSAKGACVVEPREVQEHAVRLVAPWKSDPADRAEPEGG
jgi:hypothetical protein